MSICKSVHVHLKNKWQWQWPHSMIKKPSSYKLIAYSFSGKITYQLKYGLLGNYNKVATIFKLYLITRAHGITHSVSTSHGKVIGSMLGRGKHGTWWSKLGLDVRCTANNRVIAKDVKICRCVTQVPCCGQDGFRAQVSQHSIDTYGHISQIIHNPCMNHYVKVHNPNMPTIRARRYGNTNIR